MSDFIARNKPAWTELEQLVARARKHIRRMDEEQLSRLDVLYRRTTIHLAQVRTRTQDRRLAKYLNDLTAAAHSIIYLPPRKSALAGVVQFLVEGFSRAVARTWRYHAAAAALVLAGALVAYYAASHDTLAAYALSMSPEANDPRLPGSTPEQLRESLIHGRDQTSSTKFAFASFLFSHNLQVGILSLCLGILAGVPTIYLLFYNGMIIGSFTAMHHQAGIYADYWAWILPHAVSELSAIVLCGGVGLMLGMAVLSPGELTRMERLRRVGVNALPICLGVAIMLTIAALVESYLRQSNLSNDARFIFAGGCAMFWIVYFTYGALRERAERAKLATGLGTEQIAIFHPSVDNSTHRA
ncbi:MAG TPA: stage II sporulation protein M [Pirellulales bacterium]|jgi:uncharacterized membrane protein SpoIIM required for sporulation